MSRTWRLAAVLMLGFVVSGCESKRPPTPSPGNGTGESITGRERIGWDQPADDATELATFRYAIYVDGVRSELADVSCASAAGANGFPCSGRLPSMTPGSHVLEIAAFVNTGTLVEGSKSPPLRVTVTGIFTPAGSSPLQPGEVVVTSDRVRLEAQQIAGGLVGPVDLAVAPDGRVFIAERDGRILLAGDGGVHEAIALDVAPGGLLSIALDPGFAKTHHVFVVHTVAGEGGLAFRTSRYREDGGRLIERMVLLPDLAASPEPAAALRFGADGKLYAAFDDGGSTDAAVSLADWRGKLLRLEADGRTPRDQPAASPVFWSGIRSPRGLTSAREDGLVWIAEQGVDQRERVRALVSSGQPRRPVQRAYYVLPEPTGAASLAVYRHDAVPEFEGNLFIAARDAGVILRVKFDASDPTRAVTTERLLEGRVGAVTALATAPDGAIYFCSADQLWRLVVSP